MEGKEYSKISNVLKDCFVTLTDNMFPVPLASFLFSQKCINGEELSRIQALEAKGRHSQNRELLNILMTKGDRTLDEVVKYFVGDGTQPNLVNRLQESIKKNIEIAKITPALNCSESLPNRTQTTWWPERKLLIKSFLERAVKNGNSLVEHLHAQLHCVDVQQALVAVAVIGMGGIGKTTTAKWYANKYEKEYDSIFWIESEGLLLESKIRKILKTFRDEMEGDGHSLSELMNIVYDELIKTHCLFIFDNAESYNGEHGLAELLPKRSCHHAIITSRNQDWGNETEFKIPTLELEVFSKPECIKFLRQSLQPEKLPSEDMLLKLGHEVGFLPLALHCAVATINKAKILKFAGYLERLTSDIKILLQKKVLTEYQRSISATLQISITNIEQDEEIEKVYRDACKTILHVAAYCEPNDIPIEMFYKLATPDSFTIDESVEILLQFCLLSVSKDEGGTLLHIHRLLQQVLRYNIEADPNLEVQTISTTLGCLQGGGRRFIPHCVLAWTYGLRHDAVLKKFPKFPYQLFLQEKYYIPNLADVINSSLEALRRIFHETDKVITQFQSAAIPVLLDLGRNEDAISEAKLYLINIQNQRNSSCRVTSKYLAVAQMMYNSCKMRGEFRSQPLNLNYCSEVYAQVLHAMKMDCGRIPIDNSNDYYSSKEFLD